MTMISTDNRREIAERLQGTALHGNVKYAEQFRDELIDMVIPDGEQWDYSKLLTYLAKMMDPTCLLLSKYHPETNEVGFVCSECGSEIAREDRDLGVPTYAFESAVCGPMQQVVFPVRTPRYCPNCGCRVASGEHISMLLPVMDVKKNDAENGQED